MFLFFSVDRHFLYAVTPPSADNFSGLIDFFLFRHELGQDNIATYTGPSAPCGRRGRHAG